MEIISAHVEGVARDCDGMHYSEADYEMDESEKADQFGDLEFFQRVLSYTVNTGSEMGTLEVTQDENGLPVFNWSERTEEGFSQKHVTFTKSGD